MKKAIIMIICLFAFIPFVANANVDVSKYKYTNLEDTIKAEGGKPEVKYQTSDDNVNIYLLWGKGCPHCSDFIEYLANYYKDFSHINLYAFETWYEEKNQDLFDIVGKEFSTQIRGVPFIVIGDKYFSGFSSAMESQIDSAIKAEYNKTKDKRSKRLYVTTKGTQSTTTTTGTTTTKEYPETNTTTSSYKFNTYENKVAEKTKDQKKEKKELSDTTKYIIYGLAGVIGLAFILFIIKGLKR